MTDQEKDNIGKNGQVQKSTPTGQEIKNDRRKLIAGTLASGVAVGSGITSSQWIKPAVNAVVVPSHAQTTGGSVQLTGASGVMMVSNDNSPSSIIDVFMRSANANAETNLLQGSCVILVVEDTVATATLQLNNGSSDTVVGSITGTAVTVTNILNFDIVGDLDSASNPTSADLTIIGLREKGTVTVSTNGGNCVVTAPMPNANSNSLMSMSYFEWTDDLV